MTDAAPQRLFRDEARTEAVQCLACGGPIALRGFGAIQRVVCPACGSVLRPEDSGALALLVKAAREHRTSALPLHARGQLEGATWEILGICWRALPGGAWPWQEFLLFNPYRGYRWLVYTLHDGHWSLGQAIMGAPKIVAGKHHAIAHRGRRYRHFSGYDAVVTYVEGEFPWQVQVGDRAHVDDFVAPPWGISIEESAGSDPIELSLKLPRPIDPDIDVEPPPLRLWVGPIELSRTLHRHIDPDEVWRAFAQPGSPPKSRGVGMLAPNPWRAQARSLWLSCAALLAVWYAAAQYVASSCSEREVFLRTDLDFAAPLTEEVTIGEPGSYTTLEISFTAQPLDNSWAFAEVVLIPQGREEAIGVGLEASVYHGFDGGESWYEGDDQVDVVFGRVEGGRYLLQVTPERDTSAIRSNDPFGFRYHMPLAPRSPETYGLRLREDVFLVRYAILPLPVILFFPVFAWWLGRRREEKRWQHSDHEY